MKVLAIQPFLKGYGLHPVAGGKDKAALEISRVLVEMGAQLDVLALPWGVEGRNSEWMAQEQMCLLSPDGLQARVLETVSLPDAREAGRLLWRFLTSRGCVRRPYVVARDLVWRCMVDKRRSIRKALEKSRPDLLLVHQTGSDVVPIAREAGFRGPAVLVHHSTGASSFAGAYERVVFVSAHQREELVRRVPSLKSRSEVIRYFASDEYFAACDPGPKPAIVFIGILDTKRKGLDLILDAYDACPELGSVTLHVVGEGPLRELHERRAAEGGHPVRFHGRIGHAGNAQLMAGAGAYVMPSRGEGLALVYLEALCMGVPIIGYAPNVEELGLVLEEDVGDPFQADRESPRLLAERILQLTSPSSRISVQARRRLAERARESFSTDSFHAAWRRFFTATERELT
ncbi:hypothetical protein ASA1KI_09360 [Opitutales bacterium ASA1]|uniref:glycosyltransferase family 4 protein n=1 Tax=Congregicoccus parvus TaxID=3081749 RepID=UPI002B2F0A9D|nr:hypothetical protein ASA1KI_09360 [Opitutales bacterium ASA1]